MAAYFCHKDGIVEEIEDVCSGDIDISPKRWSGGGKIESSKCKDFYLLKPTSDITITPPTSIDD